METIMRGCTSMPVAMHLPHTAPRRLVTTPRPAAARHVCRPSFSGRTARHIVASAPSTIDKTKTSAPEETEEAINAIRFLAIDAVNKANSGHPGMPMGCAPIGYLVWNEYMTHNPQNPDWFNHDRFILSNGHGSMLQYALMHLSGYKSVSVRPQPCLRPARYVFAHTGSRKKRPNCNLICSLRIARTSGSGAATRQATQRTSSHTALRSPQVPLLQDTPFVRFQIKPTCR